MDALTKLHQTVTRAYKVFLHRRIFINFSYDVTLFIKPMLRFVFGGREGWRLGKGIHSHMFLIILADILRMHIKSKQKTSQKLVYE